MEKERGQRGEGAGAAAAHDHGIICSGDGADPRRGGTRTAHCAAPGSRPGRRRHTHGALLLTQRLGRAGGAQLPKAKRNQKEFNLKSRLRLWQAERRRGPCPCRWTATVGGAPTTRGGDPTRPFAMFCARAAHNDNGALFGRSKWSMIEMKPTL